jgi:hypothetical protein
MTTYLWTVSQLDRLTADGFVVTVHYNVSATEDTYSASTYGTIGYTQKQGETYIPYADLTEATVVGWVQTSLGKDTVEASLQSQIDAQKHPVQAAGVPWSA